MLYEVITERKLIFPDVVEQLALGYAGLDNGIVELFVDFDDPSYNFV